MSFKEDLFEEFAVYAGDCSCDDDVIDKDYYDHMYDKLVEKQKEACLLAIEPMLVRDFALSELRDLYRTKILNAKILTGKEMILYKELAELLLDKLNFDNRAPKACNGLNERCNELIKILGVTK